MAWFVPAIPYIISGLAAGTTAYASYESGQAQKKMASANEDIAFNEAQRIRAETAERERVTRRKYANLMGAQRAAYSKAGVSISEGSPLEVLRQQAEDAELEALAVRQQGNARATEMMNRGSLMGWQGDNAETAGTIGAVGSIFQGAASLYNGRLRGKLPGGSSGTGYYDTPDGPAWR